MRERSPREESDIYAPYAPFTTLIAIFGNGHPPGWQGALVSHRANPTEFSPVSVSTVLNFTLCAASAEGRNRGNAGKACDWSSRRRSSEKRLNRTIAEAPFGFLVFSTTSQCLLLCPNSWTTVWAMNGPSKQRSRKAHRQNSHGGSASRLRLARA